MSDARVCFVVTELLGLVRNGGIATATTHAALVFAKQGYDVELFYCGHEPDMEPHWAQRYAAEGVSVRWLDRSQYAHPPFLADSYRLYHQLRDGVYDAVVFQDWQGLGYCSMVAKSAGLAFGRTRLIHICHGPNEWLREANRRLAVDGHELVHGSHGTPQRGAGRRRCRPEPAPRRVDGRRRVEPAGRSADHPVLHRGPHRRRRREPAGA